MKIKYRKDEAMVAVCYPSEVVTLDGIDPRARMAFL
jgi:hypothetical protein